MRFINRSAPLRAGFSLILVAGVIHPTLGRIGPSFAVDYCSWHATDVVLVEITPSPGVFRVVESWKGNLEPGSPVAIPQLLPTADAKQISSYSFNEFGARGPREQIPAQPVGSRMILFLKNEPGAFGEQWRPADVFKEIKASVVWIDRGRAMAFDKK